LHRGVHTSNVYLGPKKPEHVPKGNRLLGGVKNTENRRERETQDGTVPLLKKKRGKGKCVTQTKAEPPKYFGRQNAHI